MSFSLALSVSMSSWYSSKEKRLRCYIIHYSLFYRSGKREMSDETFNDFLKSTYEDLFPLDQGRKVWVIRRTGSNEVCVRKEVEAETCALVRRAMEVKNRHIVNIQHIIDEGDRHYIVEDFIQGATLQELADHGRHFSEEEAVDYVSQLLDGLSALHRVGIVHRDISPKNVILTPDGVIKLIDFGISHMLVPDKNNDTQLLGTVGFAAPEQFGFQRSTEKADIYSAGALLNWMLTGAMPKVVRPETGKRWKKILGGIIAVLCGFFIFVYTLDALFFSHDYFREIMSALLVFGISPLILGDYGYFDHRIPVIRLLPAWARFLIRLAIFFIVFWFGMEMYVGTGGTPGGTG